MTRNIVILSIYLGKTTTIKPGMGWSDNYLGPKSDPPAPVLPDNLLTEVRSDASAPFETFYEHDITMTLEDIPAAHSTSLSSHPTTSPCTTIMSPPVATATPTSAITATFEDGTIVCEHCKSEFKLGKNGRRGQASNLRKHQKNHHPETIPNYHRVLCECRWGCGAKDPNRSNIKVHEKQHCSKQKGKQPRRPGKWHGGDVADRLVAVGFTKSAS